jgi:two-component system response regulator RegA
MSLREHILLIDDDRSVTQGLAALLERDGRTTFICADPESAEMVLARFPITHVVTDVQFSGAFGFEGLHFLARIHLQRPECRIVLMTGFATDELRAAAKNMGAAALLGKPYSIAALVGGVSRTGASPATTPAAQTQNN